jgi:hypothetical protein
MYSGQVVYSFLLQLVLRMVCLLRVAHEAFPCLGFITSNLDYVSEMQMNWSYAVDDFACKNSSKCPVTLNAFIVALSSRSRAQVCLCMIMILPVPMRNIYIISKKDSQSLNSSHPCLHSLETGQLELKEWKSPRD